MIDIDDLIGVRYLDLGRNPKVGLDCLGCAIEVERRFGHELPDIDEAHVKRQQRNNVEIKRKLEEQTKENVIQVNKPEKEGDLILFNNNGVMNHTGVYLGNDKFIHCNIRGVHLETLSTFNVPIGRVYRWL